MTKLQLVKLIVCGLGMTLLQPANAQTASRIKKVKNASNYAAASGKQGCPGASLFQCGPIYHAQDYLGTDPDPFIRSMIQRDLGAKYGGGD